MRTSDWVADLERDMQRYLGFAEQYDEVLDQLALAIDEADERLRKAGQLWVNLLETVTSEVVREAIERRITQHESGRSYLLERAEKQAAILGKPAVDWEATDLAGNTHRLSDYAGKVVVLDFWYRDCAWCIRAMPQVNQLVKDFCNEPVAVLGMNTDSEMEDALFVENTMQLNYPSLRIDKRLLEQYGVSSFPALVILDQSGTVRDLHIGYTSVLREKAANSIWKLLGRDSEIDPTRELTGSVEGAPMR